MTKLQEFERDLAEVINKHGMDSLAKTPDYILATYTINVLMSLTQARNSIRSHESDK